MSFTCPPLVFWWDILELLCQCFGTQGGGGIRPKHLVPEDLGGLPGGAGVAQRGNYSSEREVTQRKMKEQERRNKKKEEREAKKLQTEFVYFD